jgi:hypothetical protein
LPEKKINCNFRFDNMASSEPSALVHNIKLKQQTRNRPKLNILDSHSDLTRSDVTKTKKRSHERPRLWVQPPRASKSHCRGCRDWWLLLPMYVWLNIRSCSWCRPRIHRRSYPRWRDCGMWKTGLTTELRLSWYPYVWFLVYCSDS